MRLSRLTCGEKGVKSRCTGFRMCNSATIGVLSPDDPNLGGNILTACLETMSRRLFTWWVQFFLFFEHDVTPSRIEASVTDSSD